MACNCIPSNIVIPPPSPTCPLCLRAGSAIISCLNSVPPCGEGTIDVSDIGDYSACTGIITYTIHSYDSGFSVVTISDLGIISFTLADDVVPGTFPEIRFMVECSNSIHSSVGRVKVCVQNNCSGVICEEGEQCNQCTGVCEEIPPFINAGVS